MTVGCEALADFLDRQLGIPQHPDYPQALNGLQLTKQGPVRHLAAAVDLSVRSIEIARARDADFLIVHHGMFWSGLQPIVGSTYARLRALLDANMAVYSAHLPLDSSAEYGNAELLARRLGLQTRGGFARYHDVYLGVRGECDIATTELAETVTEFAREHETLIRTTPIDRSQRTHRWAICTGAGASADTLREASTAHIDTLIVGEGPHHTAIDAIERGITIVYAGHYATETLGVQAIAQRASAEFAIPWHFVSAPTGL